MLTKLTLTVDREVVVRAKHYAKRKHRSVSRIIEDYLRVIRYGHCPFRCFRYQERTMLNPDYSDLLRLFHDHNVDFIIVGAYAMAAHGCVRATGDIDIFVRPTPENSSALFASLVAFGAPLRGVTAEDFAVPGTVYQIGVPPNRIDILTEIDGLTYDEAGRITVEVGGLCMPFLDLESLKQNKASAHQVEQVSAVIHHEHWCTP